ncbi:MAG: DEAD/DEAH box helicase family protein [Candidatus Heimdallarchaeota archaeon]|nr:DEAD/DEAH box helicase family protein [Candidatus Heimdallarchaeota archaeon]
MTLESLADLSFTPRDYQIDAAESILKSIYDDKKQTSVLLLPTGMGKTNIAVMVVVELLKKGKISLDGKVLFLSPDRKLKHQLHDVCQDDLSSYGSSFLLPEGTSLPPAITQKHFAISRFIFATPALLMNSLFARTPSQRRVLPEDLDKVEFVVIDEILDITAQTVKGGGFRMDKRFAPLIDRLRAKQGIKFLGLTASILQQGKLGFIENQFGGSEQVEFIHPKGDDFQEHAPAIKLKRFYVFDDLRKEIDQLLIVLRSQTEKVLKNGYMRLSNGQALSPNRTLLFANEVMKRSYHDTNFEQGSEAFFKNLVINAGAYLDLVVARQFLFEHTFSKFANFVRDVKNTLLLNSSEWNEVKEMIELAVKEGTVSKVSPKDLRLIQIVKKLVQEENNSVIIFLRFVEMTKFLSSLLDKEGVPNLFVHGRMSGESQNMQLKRFKDGEVKVLFASEKLIRKGTDLPEADRCIHFGTTLSIEAREQAMGRIRSTRSNLKEDITIIYHQTAEQEKYSKLVEQFLESVKSLKTSAGWTIYDDGTVQSSDQEQPDFVVEESNQEM